jgi:hypothetical protein
MTRPLPAPGAAARGLAQPLTPMTRPLPAPGAAARGLAEPLTPMTRPLPAPAAATRGLVRLLVLTLTALGVACGSKAPPSAPPAPALAPASTAPDLASRAAGTARPEPSAADRALVELKGAARKRLAADRAVISNRLGYEQALAKHARDAQGTRMRDRIPAEVTASGLEAEVAAHARAHGLTLVTLALGEAADGPPVPAATAATGPYPFSAAQLVATRALTLTLRPADEAALSAFWRRLPAGVGPLLDLTERRLDAAGDAVLSGHVYQFREVAAPAPEVRAVRLEELAREAGVAVPAEHPRLAEVRALLDEHAALGSDLAASLAVLAQTHLVGERSRFFRDRVKAVEARSLPPLTSP